jgi:phytol kinase
LEDGFRYSFVVAGSDVSSNTEAIRKSIHMLAGLGPPLGIVLVGWLGTLSTLLFILAYVVVAALLVQRGIRIPFAAAFLHRASRRHERFPIEPLAFVAAVLALVFALHEPWSFSAFAVLALGDGMATVVGIKWGRHRLAWMRQKSVEGLVAGMLVAAVAAPAFIWVGVWIHEQGYESVPLLALHPAVFVAVMGAGFVVLAALVRAVTAARPTLRFSNAPIAVTAAVLVASLAVAALPLLFAPIADIHGPLVPYETFERPFEGLVLRAAAWAALAMLVESFIRRHDNVIVPLAYVLPLVLV